ATDAGSRKNIGYTFKLIRQPKVVSIQMAEYCPRCGLKSFIKGCGLPSIFLAHVTHGPETSDDILRLVRRAIVDHYDLVHRPGLRKHAFQTAWKEPCVIIGADDDGRSLAHRDE